MADDYLFCNYKNCDAPLTKFIWVTRCSHVFCEGHGNLHFVNGNIKVKCPACKETIMRETDVIKNNINPHDMLLSCVKPDKVLDYVLNSLKIWTYQMQQKKKISMSKLTEDYEKYTSDALLKYKTESNEMKKFILEVEGKLRAINEALIKTKKKLWKYKMAYRNLCLKQKSNQAPHPEHNPQFFFDRNSEEAANQEVEDIFNQSIHGRAFPSP